MSSQWRFFQHFLFRPDSVYLRAGDESIVSKSGKKSYGSGWFFSAILHTPPARSGVLLDCPQRRHQETRLSSLDKAGRSLRGRKGANLKTQSKTKARVPPKPRGRPKGRKNKNKADVTLSLELPRLLAQGQEGMKLIREKLTSAYFVLDGPVGNAFATSMGRQMGLHILSKMPPNAELYQLPTAAEKADRLRLK